MLCRELLSRMVAQTYGFTYSLACSKCRNLSTTGTSDIARQLHFEVVQIFAVSFGNGEDAVEANRKHHQPDDGSRIDDL